MKTAKIFRNIARYTLLIFGILWDLRSQFLYRNTDHLPVPGYPRKLPDPELVSLKGERIVNCPCFSILIPLFRVILQLCTFSITRLVQMLAIRLTVFNGLTGSVLMPGQPPQT